MRRRPLTAVTAIMAGLLIVLGALVWDIGVVLLAPFTAWLFP